MKTFAVSGTGPFPVDMLRRDCCWPLSTADAVGLFETKRRVVSLTTNNDYGPTEGRWESFGWHVVLDASHEDDAEPEVKVKLSEADYAELRRQALVMHMPLPRFAAFRLVYALDEHRVYEETANKEKGND